MKLPPWRDDPVWARLRQHDVLERWDPSAAPHIAAAHGARMALLHRLITGRLPAPARILDVGCAQGTLGLLLAEEGYLVTLLDVRPEAIAYARERHERGDVEFVVGRIGPDTPRHGDYDAVICTEVLEHVARPGELLAALSSKARPGGTLLLTTPNGRYWFSRLPTYSTVSQAVIDAASADSLDGDAHRFLFARDELLSLVRGAGLRVEACGFFSPFWLEGHLKTRWLHRLHFSAWSRAMHWPAERALLPSRLCASQWVVARRAGGK